MLNKRICKKCYMERRGKDPNAEYYFEQNWNAFDNAICGITFAGTLEGVDIYANPPDKCPYILEQLLVCPPQRAWNSW